MASHGGEGRRHQEDKGVSKKLRNSCTDPFLFLLERQMPLFVSENERLHTFIPLLFRQTLHTKDVNNYVEDTPLSCAAVHFSHLLASRHTTGPTPGQARSDKAVNRSLVHYTD